MPANLTVAAGVVLDSPPDRLWELAVDWSRQHEWIWATRVHGGHGAGATVVGWTGIGPVGFTDTMVITQWDPPRRGTVTHTGKIVRGSGIFEVLPRGDRAEFRWTERIEIPLPRPLGRLAAVVAGPVARIALGLSLRRFARLAQSPG